MMVVLLYLSKLMIACKVYSSSVLMWSTLLLRQNSRRRWFPSISMNACG